MYAAFTGRLIRRKHVDTLIRALAPVQDVTLLVIGDRPERRSLDKLAHDVGVSKRVNFAGETPHVHLYLQAADMFLFPSMAEGLAHAPMEAMATGLPVAVAPTAGTREFFGQDERGLVVHTDDVKGWTAAICRFAEDREFAAEIGGRGCEFLRGNFSIQKTAEKITAAYHRMLEEDGRR